MSAKYAFIQAEKAKHPVARLCKLLGVSPAGFYKHQSRPASARAVRESQVRARIKTIHTQSRGTYGYGRVHPQLIQEGVRIDPKTVYRFMVKEGLRGRRGRQYKTRTTVQNPDIRLYPHNLVARNFTPEGPNQLWVTDTTFLPTHDGWLYLAVVLDCWSRRVVGYAMGAQNSTTLCLRALEQALDTRVPGPGLVHHSDRGATYSSRVYQQRLLDAGVTASMSRTGDCYDNAMMESFFGSMKTEIDVKCWRSRSEAATDVFSWIEGFYNPRRLHSGLDYRSPEQFEKSNWPESGVEVEP